MQASQFVSSVVDVVGADAVHGAIVFAALDRPIDDLIRLSLALGPYHPGHSSPWSHCFLIAEPFHGKETEILDCTIRGKNGEILWNEPLTDLLKTGLTKAGGIYTGRLGDYDDERISRVGLKLLPELSAPRRAQIVVAGRALQRAGYHYDIPGLLRELVRFLTGIHIKPGKKLLFCSAFCQEAYRRALSSDGDFAPGARSPDVTPDDIWYSTAKPGRRFPDQVVFSRRRLSKARRGRAGRRRESR